MSKRIRKISQQRWKRAGKEPKNTEMKKYVIEVLKSISKLKSRSDKLKSIMNWKADLKRIL